jgi:hypothetical protein
MAAFPTDGPGDGGTFQAARLLIHSADALFQEARHLTF